MRPLLSLFALISFTAAGCASSVPLSDNAVVVSEISVVNGRNPVLFVGRNPDDGQWILLTDERAPREIVVYALFQDLVTFDSTLAQVRDLPVGWKATRTAIGSPWVRQEYSMTQPMTAQRDSALPPRGSPRRKPGPSSKFLVTVAEKNQESQNTRQIMMADGSLSIWLVEGTETSSSTLLWQDTATKAANRTVDSLVLLCGLDTLKEVYSGPSHSSGREFSVFVWDVAKEQSTMSRLRDHWIPSLYELCAYINSLLPRRYAMELAFPKE